MTSMSGKKERSSRRVYGTTRGNYMLPLVAGQCSRSGMGFKSKVTVQCPCAVLQPAAAEPQLHCGSASRRLQPPAVLITASH
jgi:hypothetical protein